MQKILVPIFALLFVINSAVTAQVKVTAKPVKKVMTLVMPGENGANGASVIWHPVQKKYYSGMAGNMTFPFAVFDATGKRLSGDSLETLMDLRGIWYNTVSKKIEANGYNENGWIRYQLNVKGIPEDFDYIHEGMVQPGEHSVGVFDIAKKRVTFFFEGKIVAYSAEGEELVDETFELLLGGTEAPGDDEVSDVEDQLENYNGSSLCYTGLVNAEFAVLNTTDLQIELYNRKGVFTKAFKLPEGTPAYTNFNFAYANGIWWLFDKEARKWFGFK